MEEAAGVEKRSGRTSGCAHPDDVALCPLGNTPRSVSIPKCVGGVRETGKMGPRAACGVLGERSAAPKLPGGKPLRGRQHGTQHGSASRLDCSRRESARSTCCSGWSPANKSGCGGSKTSGTSRRKTRRLLARKDTHDFPGQMRYQHFHRIRVTSKTCRLNRLLCIIL